MEVKIQLKMDRSPNWQNPQRTPFRFFRTQTHGDAMYLGAMAVPAEIMEGHGIGINVHT